MTSSDLNIDNFVFFISPFVEYKYCKQFRDEFNKFCLISHLESPSSILSSYHNIINKTELLKDCNLSNSLELELIATVIAIKHPTLLTNLFQTNYITLNRHLHIPRINFSKALEWLQLNVRNVDKVVQMFDSMLEILDLSTLDGDTITENFGHVGHHDDMRGFHPIVQLEIIYLLINKYNFTKINLDAEKILQSVPYIGGSHISIYGGNSQICLSHQSNLNGDLAALRKLMQTLESKNIRINVYSWYQLWQIVWNGMHRNLPYEVYMIISEFPDVFYLEHAQYGNFITVLKLIFDFEFPNEQIYYMSTYTLKKLLFKVNDDDDLTKVKFSYFK